MWQAGGEFSKSFCDGLWGVHIGRDSVLISSGAVPSGLSKSRRAPKRRTEHGCDVAMNEVLPLILLFLFGGFAVLIAALKGRARITAPTAVTLAVLEAISGLALMVLAFPTSGTLETAARMGVVTALMVGLSASVHLIHVRKKSRAREASEGRRLHYVLKFGIDAKGEVFEPIAELDVEPYGDAEDAGARETGLPSET